MIMQTDSKLGVSTMQRHHTYYLRDGNICFLVSDARRLDMDPSMLSNI